MEIFNEDLNTNNNVRAGDFLLAEPMLSDPNFQRSVILVCEHDAKKGSFGLVLTQRADVIVNDDNLQPYLEGNLYVGGPVQQNTLHYIHQLPDLPGSIKLRGNVFWGGDFDELQARLKSGAVSAADCRFFMGYSGWGAGQLDQELSQNSWVIARESPNLIFTTSPVGLWKQILLGMGGKYAMYTNFPTDPSLN